MTEFVGQRHVAVIGAGMAGLAAAWRLQQAGCQVTVFERQQMAGGRVRTVTDDGFVIDVGAGILPSTYVDLLAMMREAGLTHLTQPVTGCSATVYGDLIYRIRLQRPRTDLALSPLLGWRSKLRLLKLGWKLLQLRDALRFDTLSDAAQSDSESIMAYAQRELDPDLLERFLDPLVRTMYLNGAEEASVVETLWSFKNLAADSSFAIRGGMARLTDELARRLTVHYGVEVRSVAVAARGAVVDFASAGGGEQRTMFDAAVVALDAQDVHDVLGASLSDAQRGFLGRVRYSTSVNLHWRLRSAPDLDALLVQVPHSVDPDLAGLVLDHLKAPDRAPPGKGLISSFFLSPWGARMRERSDAEVIADALPRVGKVIPGIERLVEGVTIERWPRAALICYAGYSRELAAFEVSLDPRYPIQIASDLFAPSCLNVAVVQGQRAARRILAQFARPLA